MLFKALPPRGEWLGEFPPHGEPLSLRGVLGGVIPPTHPGLGRVVWRQLFKIYLKKQWIKWTSIVYFKKHWIKWTFFQNIYLKKHCMKRTPIDELRPVMT